MLQTWDMLVFVARLRKKNELLFYGEVKSVEKTKL